MKRLIISIVMISVLVISVVGANAATFLPGVSSTSGWHDADKTIANTDDDLMCWAATASNMLRWGNWNAGTSISTTDDIFQNFQYHWDDVGGRAAWGIQWWFDGSDPSGGDVQVPGGGGPWTTDLFYASYAEVYSGGAYSPLQTAMSDIASFIDNGMATGLSISTGIFGVGHAITVWGHELLTATTGTLWITDSDDYLGTDNLFAVSMLFDSGGWYLDNYGAGDYFIRGVYGLDANPTPVPGAVWLFGSGLIGLVGLRRIRRS